jgi:hypothetical protein
MIMLVKTDAAFSGPCHECRRYPRDDVTWQLTLTGAYVESVLCTTCLERLGSVVSGLLQTQVAR